MVAAHNGASRSTASRAWGIRGQHFLADPAVRKNIRASLPLRQHNGAPSVQNGAPEAMANGARGISQGSLGDQTPGSKAASATPRCRGTCSAKPAAPSSPATQPPATKPEDPPRTPPPDSKRAKRNGLLVSRQRAFLTLELALNGLSAFHASGSLPARIISLSSIICSTSRPISAPSTRSSSAKSPNGLSLVHIAGEFRLF
jgi:hypothetical protein